MERPGRHGRACLAFPRSAQAAAQDDQTRSQRRWPEWVRMLGPSRSAPAPAPSQWTEQPVVKPRSQLCRRLRVSGGGPRVASAQSLSECGRCRCCSRAGLGAWKVRGTESGQAWGQESWAEASSRPGAPARPRGGSEGGQGPPEPWQLSETAQQLPILPCFHCLVHFLSKVIFIEKQTFWPLQ